MDLYIVLTLLGLVQAAAASHGYNGNQIKQCTNSGPAKFGFPVSIGDINSTTPIAPTGLAHSRRFKGVLYFVNDGNVGGTTIFAINAYTAEIIGSITITDATNLAWEDLTVGRCPRGIYGYCIYVQDAGLNGTDRADIIYVIKEPRNPAKHISKEADLIINYTLEPGTTILSSNGLFVDCYGDIFFFDVLFGGRGVRLFKLKNVDGNYTASALFQVDLPTSSAGPVALSLSADCCELLIKMPDVVYYIPIVNDQFQVQSFQPLPYKPNEDEESIAWGLRQDRYFTVSETAPHTLKVAFRNRRAPKTRFSLGRSTGTIDNTLLSSLVALASSRKHQGFVYTASNSGLDDILIVQVFQAQSVGSIHLGLGAGVVVRDIATSPCPTGFNSSDCIYVSALVTGNATENTVFVFEEPENVFAVTEQIIGAANELTFTLPNDGIPWAIFVGYNGQIYIMDYVLRKEVVTVFELNQNIENTTAVPIANFTSHSLSAGPVAADISPCQNEILVKFRDLVLLFDVKRYNVADAFSREPAFLPYIPESDGQSISFSSCNAYLTTTRESTPVPLLLYRRVRRSKSKSRFRF